MTEQILTARAVKSGVVLIVDDSATNRLKLNMLVRSLGHHVELAGNGKEGLARLARGGIDLVLLDIVMPEIDGFEVLRRMSQDQDLKEVPVLVISSLDDMDDIVKAIELGAKDFLNKNFDAVLLEARVSTCLEGKRLRDIELDYLREVGRLSKAARIVERTNFAPDKLGLGNIAARPDPLGDLARVFLHMASEVHRREQNFRQQISLLKGTLLLLLIGLSWGLMPTLARMLMSKPIDPIGTTASVLAINAGIMLAVSLLRGRMPRLSLGQIGYAIILALIGTVLPQIVIYTVAQHVPAIAISIALATESLIVFVLAAALGAEAPSFKRFLGLSLGFVSVALIILPEQSVAGLTNPLWFLVILLVPLCYGLGGLLIASWPKSENDPVQAATMLMVAGALISWPLAHYYAVIPPLSYLTEGVGRIIPVISLLSCFSTTLIVYAVHKTGAVFASQKAYAITAAGVVWSMLLLNETPSVWIWGALACLMSGLLLVRPKDDVMIISDEALQELSSEAKV